MARLRGRRSRWDAAGRPAGVLAGRAPGRPGDVPFGGIGALGAGVRVTTTVAVAGQRRPFPPLRVRLALEQADTEARLTTPPRAADGHRVPPCVIPSSRHPTPNRSV